MINEATCVQHPGTHCTPVSVSSFFLLEGKNTCERVLTYDMLPSLTLLAMSLCLTPKAYQSLFYPTVHGLRKSLQGILQSVCIPS